MFKYNEYMHQVLIMPNQELYPQAFDGEQNQHVLLLACQAVDW